jgi:hypothetical protein
VLSTDFALIWGEKIVQKAQFLINREKERIAGWFTLTPMPDPATESHKCGGKESVLWLGEPPTCAG